VDIPQLSAEFATAPPELQSKVNDGLVKVRYTQYVQAMAVFDEVLNNPALNEKQKKLLTQVLGQLKEVATKAPSPGQ